jgi:hypothetical protein
MYCNTFYTILQSSEMKQKRNRKGRSGCTAGLEQSAELIAMDNTELTGVLA